MKDITGSSYYAGGTHTAGAAIIQPAAYVRGLGAGVAPQVEIFESSPVLRIEQGRDHGVSTAKGKVTAPKIILTVNGHVESFGYFVRRLLHVFTFASLTRQLSDSELQTLGRLIVDLATKTSEPMLQDILAQPPPRRLYPEPFMTIGAQARLWWMHQRAGRDL
jgi:glycine/D-amino acid oxidase-like deaminating enzyme